MRKLTTIILMMCLSCQLVLKLSIIAWFEINQDYIASTLCENKNRPELVCCGKCVLTKHLKNAEDTGQKDHNSTSSKAQKTTSVVFVLPNNSKYNKAVYSASASIQNAVLPHHFGIALDHSIFHPPSIIYS